MIVALRDVLLLFLADFAYISLPSSPERRITDSPPDCESGIPVLIAPGGAMRYAVAARLAERYSRA
jgi:hypothetical protein